MLVVNYNGSKPITDYYKYGVEGNNNADVIRFVIQKHQGQLDLLENSKVFVKCQNDDFSDKIEIDEENIKDEGNNAYVDWFLMKKHTTQGSLQVSLCFECENEVVWQTQIFTLKIMNGVVADDEIVNDYPTILQQLQKQINELSAGSGELKIEKIWLKQEQKAITFDALTEYDDENQRVIINNAENTYICLKSTPIGDKAKEEITKGRLVIRLNYPVNKNKRGFSHCLNPIYAKRNYERAIIFITEDNIRENAYGESYIYYQESFLNFVNRFFSLEDMSEDFVALTYGGAYRDLVYALCQVEYNGWRAGGFPRYDEHDETLGKGVARFNMPNTAGVGWQVNGDNAKIRPSYKLTEYNFYAPLIVPVYDATSEKVFCDFWRNNEKRKKEIELATQWEEPSNFNNYYFDNLKYHNETRFVRRRLARCNFKPSFAILDENYKTLSLDDNCWIKTYPQSEQSINLALPSLFLVNDYNTHLKHTVAVARIRITQKA